MRPVSYESCMQCHADLMKEGVKRKRCAGCHSVFYDNVVCQKKDWAIHKTECKERQRRFIAAVRRYFPAVDTMAKLLAISNACSIIAGYYYNGDCGFEQNDGLALFWTLQWMKGGDVEAMLLLGTIYTSGDMPHKSKEGVKLLRRACEKKEDPEAQFRIGQCYFAGDGVEVDKHEALKWYRLSAEGGLALGQHQLGNMILRGVVVKTDYDEALFWLRKVAKQGEVLAQYNAGTILFNKAEVSGRSGAEAKEAAKWLRKAAEQGDAKSQCALGVCYLKGLGVAKDPTEAVVWIRKSADQGCAAAQHDLGNCYRDGTGGVGVDHVEALRLFRLAGDQGYDSALMDADLLRSQISSKKD